MKSIRESVRRLLREEVLDVSKYYRRRITLDEIKLMLSVYTDDVYYKTTNYNQFKYELTLDSVERIMWEEYGIGYEDLPERETIEFVTYVSEIFDEYITLLYNQTKNL